MLEIELVVPERAGNLIENDLVKLTQTLVENGHAEYMGGLLGGLYGYGANFKNDVFMMHSYCWCDEDDCPWCMGCDCPEDAYTYLVDDKRVTLEEWSTFFNQYCGPYPGPNASKEEQDRWSRLADEANSRRDIIHNPTCDYCTGRAGTEYGAEPGRAAPNFWYYGKSGQEVKIWWYKWIGRGMEYNRTVDTEEWLSIFKECLDSLRVSSDG